MPTTPRHGLQKWSSGFTQSDMILNPDLDMLDVRVALAVRSRTENAPLGGDAAGDCYIVTGSPSGAFSAFTEDHVAYYDGTTWYEFAPIQGQVAWVDDDSEGVTFDGAGWVVTSADLSGYATEAYVNAALVGLVDLKGDYDADTNTPDLDTSPSGIFKGDAWECSVAGTFFTFELDVGDILVAKQDDPTTEAHWIINKEAGGSGGGLDEAEVDARVVAVAGTALNSKHTNPLSLMSDNTAESIDIGADRYGNLIITTNISGEFAVVGVRITTGAVFCFSIASSSDFAFTTGALTGTTGADTKTTISVHTDRKIYVENRRGTSRKYYITQNLVA